MIGLSKSSLDLFKNCPRCFWLDKIKKLKRPEGIKASIMNGIDDCMKQVSEMSVTRETAVSYLEGIRGATPFPDREKLKKFMHWSTFKTTVNAGRHRVLIWGNLDDLIQWPDRRVSPWDFKSNGKKRDWQEYTEQYNLLQADMYDLILPAQGLETTGDAYFTYAWPIVLDSGAMTFDHETVSVKTDGKRALDVLERATDCLMGEIPDHSPSCEYCTFVYQRSGT